jgi:hypothetical protein
MSTTFLCVWNVWLAHNVQWIGIWLFLFGPPKNIKHLKIVLKSLLVMNKFIKVNFFVIWGVGELNLELQIVAQASSSTLHTCHTSILHETSNKLSKENKMGPNFLLCIKNVLQCHFFVFFISLVSPYTWTQSGSYNSSRNMMV